MGFTKNDCVLLLTELEAHGVNVDKQINGLFTNSILFEDVLQFINQQRPIDICDFYTKIRKSYNQKKSKLYINIVSPKDETPDAILTTLSSLLLQIFLYAQNNAQMKAMFLNHARAKEIADCISNYMSTFDLIPCLQLLQIIKCDVKAFESITKAS